MKKLISLFIFSLAVFISNAQILDPVKFTTSVEKISDTDFNLVIKADIESGWHLYSQNVPEDGPIPTTIYLKDSLNTFQLIGKPIEDKGHEIDDPVFGMRIKFFEDEAVFKQRIHLLTNNKVDITSEIEYMVCDDSQCLPPTYKDINFSVQGIAGEFIENTNAIISKPIEKVEKKNAVTNNKTKDNPESKKGLWSIFILSFLGGFAALLTPCVFPMIPMTVSFFTKQSKTKAKGIKNAVFYGLSIIAIYVFLGSVVTAIFGADSLNALSTNVWFNLIFFILLVIFAISFFGAFEIVLPSSWGTKIDAQADRGGIIGILFMALALAIVSFSCTGPIVGTLLVEAASKGGIAPIIGMLGFSSALALPFALFAAFPGWLNSLPKSGGWLNTVKVTLGFLELALAFKFLSNADLVLQLHLLEREIFLAIWIAIFGGLALYLFGKIKLPHDSPSDHISVGRLSLGLIVLSFTIYLIPGLWGAPLKLISGFPPPLHYSESPYGVGNTKGNTTSLSQLPEDAHYGPHDIISFHDYEKGMAYAKKVNKPVMIDFTGHACVNCRKMEDYVWPNPKVLEILKNDIVLISLYVDDKRKLPEDEQIISEITGKKLRFIGQKWSEFQALKYKTNSQPYYVLVNHNGENLNEPTAYDPNVDNYYNWLKDGLSNF
ncbi:protein-disulfide reductase DsbD family protein [Urechidicola croceus]|uniref:Thiol:disulfide interchange protein n=1 Tax=Urechidicola croceus TaxID=1850246 RepID=A0A1D8PAE4_9FLAO|nr:thioredoxin family protein [Urechidicola croceus]AOW21564.1 thiol:disulfide interchange protein [Urechidicola croceus]